MALITSLKAKENSRHGLRTRLFVERIPPGGKCVCLLDHFFRQQGDQELAVQPGCGAVIVVLGQVPQFGNLFETLEH